MTNVTSTSTNNSKSGSGTVSTAPRCVLDRNVVNSQSLANMTNVALSMFAPLCGRNRGAFVLNPTDGKTYGCTDFPRNFGELAGIIPTSGDDQTANKWKKHGFALKDANSITEGYANGNLTASQTVKALDTLVHLVYHSTPHVDAEQYACEVSGLAKLECSSIASTSTIRSVTLAGVFAHVPGVSQQPLTLEQAQGFYTDTDFANMHKMGLNAVQIPVPVSMFDGDNDSGRLSLLDKLVSMAQSHELQVMVVLEEDDKASESLDSVTKASLWAMDQTIYALGLPSMESHGAARAVAPQLTLLVPATMDALESFPKLDDRTYAALDASRTDAVADVASSTKPDDRSKMFYHEATTCMLRSSLEYLKCYRHVPALITQGFDLTIDDCVFQNSNDGASSFVDYGQCRHFAATVESPWWHRHRASLAARQLASYEHGLGWSFAAWKLFDSDDVDGDDTVQHPAQLLSLSNVAAAGLFPSLHSIAATTASACLNPPDTDFILGDETLSPTPGPPPDCGNGWWNFTSLQCDYWVPPAPTLAPTLPPPVYIKETDNSTLGLAAIVGLVVGSVVVYFVKGRRNSDYTAVPEASLNV